MLRPVWVVTVRVHGVPWLMLDGGAPVTFATKREAQADADIRNGHHDGRVFSVDCYVRREGKR